MLRIGSAYSQIGKESKKEYIKLNIAKELTKRGFTIHSDDNVYLFLNEDKTEDRHPDYIAYIANKEEEKEN